MAIDYNPHHRAFTGGVGKPTKARRNDGRINPDRQTLTQYPIRPANIYEKLKPYATNGPITKVVNKAPKHLTPEERKRWHKLRKMGIVK